MRSSALVASATLALSLLSAPATAHEPHWIFEVPLDLETLNQEVDYVKVRCETYDHPYQGLADDWIGRGDSDEINPNAQGNIPSVTTVEVNARPGVDPGNASHYSCIFYLYTAPNTRNWCNNHGEIAYMPKPGTVCIYKATGALFP